VAAQLVFYAEGNIRQDGESMLDKIRQEFTEGKHFLQFGVLKAFGQTLGMIAPLIIAKFLPPGTVRKL